MKVDGRKLSHAKLEEIRFAAVKAVQAGQSPSAVARAMGLYSNRIFVWLAAYRSGGWDALRSRKASGRPKRLTGAQLKWIYNTVTTRNPLQLRFPFALWIRAMIRALIRRKYGIKLSAVSVGRLLAQMGLTCQKPLSRAFEQDASLIKRWMEREFPKLRALAKKERAVIFFSDESGVRSDFHAGTTWGCRARPRLLRIPAGSSQHAIGHLSQRRIAVHDLAQAHFGGAVNDFLRRLITNYPRKIFLVVDGLPAHKAKSVRQFLAGVKSRIRLSSCRHIRLRSIRTSWSGMTSRTTVLDAP